MFSLETETTILKSCENLHNFIKKAMPHCHITKGTMKHCQLNLNYKNLGRHGGRHLQSQWEAEANESIHF